ncbi:MAG TPA: addiction module antidote protein [Candidatus Acidoferrales bacterium]|jgi:probable addiction module antidote protein|nr:addiction module antidote protein [Candidatus Acidoferrales bacterium]
MPRNVNYKDDLLADLRNDAGFSAAYLSAAMADSREAFLVAVRDVAEARVGGIANLASEANMSRETLYRALSVAGNPRFSTLESLLGALGMNLTVKLKASAVRVRRGVRRRSRRSRNGAL